MCVYMPPALQQRQITDITEVLPFLESPMLGAHTLVPTHSIFWTIESKMEQGTENISAIAICFGSLSTNI